MSQLGLLLVLGLALLPILATLRGHTHTTVFYWALSGVILWATGLSLVLGERYATFLVLSHVAGPVSATLFFLGARRFARRDPLPWAPAFGTAGGLLTGLVFFTLGREMAVAVEIAISFPLLITSAWVVNESAWRTRASLPEKALGVVLVLLAVVMPTDIVTRLYVDLDRILLQTWTTLSFAIGFLTLAALAERAAARARRLTQELRERTHALEVERGTLVALVESAPLGIVLTDLPGRIRFVNNRAAGILRIDPSETWIGRPVTELAETIDGRLDPQGHEQVGALAREFSSPKAILPGVDLALDQGERIMAVMSQPVCGEDGRLLGRVWIGRDVTEERRVSARISQAQRMETVGTLAGGIAHDFNNQLTSILGNLEILLPKLPDDETGRGAAKAVEQAAHHCAELTQGLLTFARQRAPSAGSADVKAVVREVVALLRPSLAPGVKLKVSVAEGTGGVLTNADELRRVLMNLGVNALDAVAGVGAIEIRARKLDTPSGARVELVVEDDGTGMDEATRRRIFDPFFTTKEPGKGTGLGLSVVYGIAQTRGARIEVESAPGTGTTFRLLWPITSGDPSRSAAPEPPTEAAQGSVATVLLGEDDPSVRNAIRGMLERAGYRVLASADGPSTVACFRERSSDVDLVLLDLAMPGCNGLEVLRQIHRQAPGRPAILMSGNPEPITGEAVVHSEILLKPFGSRELLTRIQEVLGGPVARV